MKLTGAAPAQALFIGDQDSDRQAAATAGIDFCWAKDFFGWETGIDEIIAGIKQCIALAEQRELDEHPGQAPDFEQGSLSVNVRQDWLQALIEELELREQRRND